MRNLLLVVLILLVMAVPAQAFEGHVAFDYDLNGAPHAIELFVYENLDENLLVGGKILGQMNTIDLELPELLGYEFVAEMRLDEHVTINFTAGNEDIMKFLDLEADYAKIGVKYEF